MKILPRLIPLIAALLIAGCNNPGSFGPHPLSDWIGVEVTVLFRRDVLGAAGDPIAPTSTWLNNTKVSLDGRILTAHEEGIYLDSRYKVNSGDSDLRHSLFWIPASSILAIERRN
jgi:hypothetical protein